MRSTVDAPGGRGPLLGGEQDDLQDGAPRAAEARQKGKDGDEAEEEHAAEDAPVVGDGSGVADHRADSTGAPLPGEPRLPSSRGFQDSVSQGNTGTTLTPKPRSMTPQQRKQERLRRLAAEHKVALKRLAAERQHILRHQALYGAISPAAAMAATASTSGPVEVEPPLWRPASAGDSREARAAARAALVSQLMMEQQAAEEALAALKQGSSLAAARQLGAERYQEQQLRLQQHRALSQQARLLNLAANTQAQLPGTQQAQQQQQQHQQQQEPQPPQPPSWAASPSEGPLSPQQSSPLGSSSAPAGSARAHAHALERGAGSPVLPGSPRTPLLAGALLPRQHTAPTPPKTAAGSSVFGGCSAGGRGSAGVDTPRHRNSSPRASSQGPAAGGADPEAASPPATAAPSDVHSSARLGPAGLDGRPGGVEAADGGRAQQLLITPSGGGSGGSLAASSPRTPPLPASSGSPERPPLAQPQPAAATPPQHPPASAPPAYIQDLMQQVQALQAAVEQQVQQQQRQQQQQGPMLMPPYMPMPMYMQPPPPLQPPPPQPPPSPPAPPAPPSPPPDPIMAALPPELAADPALQSARLQHGRQLAALRMEIEVARTAAELEQARAELQQLRAQGGYGAGGYGGEPDQLAQLQRLRDEEEAAAAQELHGHAAEAEAEAPGGTALQGGGTGEQQEGEAELPPREEEMAATQRLGVTGLEPEQAWPEDGLPLVQGEPPLDAGDEGGAEGAGGDPSELLELAAGGPEGGPHVPAAVEAAGEGPESHVLEVHLRTAGPFSKRGTYRIRVVLYDGYQPMEAAPGVMLGASSRRVEPTPDGQPGHGHAPAAPSPGPAPARQAPGAAAGPGGGGGSSLRTARFHETLRLVGVALPPTALLVFELYVAKQVVAGMPGREALVGWAFAPALAGPGLGLAAGRQVAPLFRLPLIIAAPRKYSYELHACVEFELARKDVNPGDSAAAATAAASAARSAGEAARGDRGPHRLEDLPGVSCAAWLRVARGPPPCDPFTPGDGFVVCVDGARFLPANVTVTKCEVSLWSASRRLLGQNTFYALSWPDSDATHPRFSKSASLGTGSDKFDDGTATLVFKVTTLERWTRAPCVVGWALLPAFLDPRTQQQPVSAFVLDYALNQGAFQLPLHVRPPPGGEAKLHGGSLDATPRLPCASLLVRLLPPQLHKMQRPKAPPEFSDRVYDSTRTYPTPLERKLFDKYLRRRRLPVREAARLLVGGRPPARAAQQEEEAGEDVAVAAPLPGSDVELMDWIDSQLATRAGPGPDPTDRPLPYNRSSEYHPDLGFWVALDGAMRLQRNLPAAAILTFAPPGGFYQDSPITTDVQLTLDYDLTAPLAAPRWTDGWVHFGGVVHEAGACVIVDVRLLVPSTGASAPAGWTCVRLFEREGPFVASGYYHLPLFAGLPSRALLQEIASKGDVDAVIARHLQVGRIRVHEDCGSVLLRLMDVSREGQMDAPATSVPLASLRRPGYCSAAPQLGPRHYAAMCKEVRNKTYAQAKPKNLTDDAWIEMINDAIIKAAGLDAEGDEEEGEEGDADEDVPLPPDPSNPLATPRRTPTLRRTASRRPTAGTAAPATPAPPPPPQPPAPVVATPTPTPTPAPAPTGEMAGQPTPVPPSAPAPAAPGQGLPGGTAAMPYPHRPFYPFPPYRPPYFLPPYGMGPMGMGPMGMGPMGMGPMGMIGPAGMGPMGMGPMGYPRPPMYGALPAPGLGLGGPAPPGGPAAAAGPAGLAAMAGPPTAPAGGPHGAAGGAAWGAQPAGPPAGGGAAGPAGPPQATWGPPGAAAATAGATARAARPVTGLAATAVGGPAPGLGGGGGGGLPARPPGGPRDQPPPRSGVAGAARAPPNGQLG